MSTQLKARIAELLPTVPPPKRWTARELLHALLEHADLECFQRDGRARLVLELSPDLLDELAVWEADAPEDEQIDEANS